MNTSNEKKARLLGMPFGTAGGKLRKKLLFNAIHRLGEDICFRCGRPILTEAEFSIEHKKSWALSSEPIKMFFDINNISYSHLSCNVSAGYRDKKYNSIAEKSAVNNFRRRSNPNNVEQDNACRRDKRTKGH